MSNWSVAGARELVDHMLGMIEPDGYEIEHSGTTFNVAVGENRISFDPNASLSTYAFERLTSAIEARIAYERAMAMRVAAGGGDSVMPLWLVSGPDMLGRWLSWARAGAALRKVLVLSSRIDAAPVVGDLARRARRDLGQGGARIRVRAGMAMAERIELSHRTPCVVVMGRGVHIKFARQRLPETLVTALKDDPQRNDRWRLAAIVDHPFFATHDFAVVGVHNDGDDLALEVETSWAPLEPIPAAAWNAVPRNADPRIPWRATAREAAELHRLSEMGQRLLRRES